MPPSYHEERERSERQRNFYITNPDTSSSSSNWVTDAPPPPRYSLVFGDPDEQVPSDSPQSQHDFWFSSGVFKSRPWAGLRIFTRPSLTTHRVPRVYGRDAVAGLILLELSSTTTINSIVLSLKGRIVTSFAEQGVYTFLEENLIIWTRQSGSSSQPTSPVSPTSPFVLTQPGGSKIEGKFPPGSHEIPFTIPFPTEINISTGYTGKGRRSDRPELLCYTPQSFLERHLNANIEYELVVKINYGILKQDFKLTTSLRFRLKAPIIYIPEIRPESPFQKRLTCYMYNLPLVSSPDDPDGWQALPSINITGTFGREKAVVLEYTLCYTRGTVIPCFIQLSCPDRQCLAALSTPALQNVRLGRRVTYFKDPNKGIDQHFQIRAFPESRSVAKYPSSSWEFDEAETAIWWEPQQLDNGSSFSSDVRWLEGEIHLADDLPPTSSFVPLTIEYAIEVMPFETSSFRQAASRRPEGSSSYPTKLSLEGHSSQILLSYPVTIATCHHNGPRARAYTKRQKPSMAKKRSKDEGDALLQLAQYGSLSPFHT
ncbi:hypothetical protein CPB83DRAFT_814250 [Crepidotus variabilis]|uniref:Arrestin-like N-terminal domain-containing protein n=1 Tax=Crepidotus variabilis TaxID=179855 RepID=A0A9P6EFT9_9AGAR|nr:hypothetical protein CPB83DRAFT_814250 [Crepidotus variabilis]